MSIWHIYGGNRMTGSTQVQGAKNAVLPIMAASVLAGSETVLHNVPDLKDVTITLRILRHLGCTAERDGDTVRIDSRGMNRDFIPHDLMRELRSSVIFLGAILTRFGTASLSMPGGCELGPRPVNLHLDALRALGAEVTERGGDIVCCAHDLKGRRILLPFPSVGATENAMLAALGADGCTTIENAACEPEIADLGAFLCACGADLCGAGTPTIEIEGGKALHGATYTILPDRIETATYLCACAACGGALTLHRAAPASCAGVIEVLGQCGCRIRCGHDTISIHRQGPLTACRPVTARPYPGFPTDAMPVLLAAQLGAQGKTSFTETIFENRFLYVQELQKLGAKLSQDGRTVRLQGAEPLHAARLHAGDLRGGAALVLGAMQAEGESTIFGVKHIQRGYDNLEAALQSAGARLKTVEIPIKV